MGAAVRSVPIGGFAAMWSSQVSEQTVASARVAPAVEVLARLRDADDRTLIAAFLSGERDAFEVLVEPYRRQVYQPFYRFLG